MSMTGGARRLLKLTLMVCLAAPGTSLADSFTVSGSPTVGALPTIMTAFANQGGTDVFPPGITDYYVFTLFDTGSTRVYLDAGTAASLGVSHGTVADVRINGLGAIDPITLTAPIDAGQAQAEVQDVPVSVPAAGPDVTLIGGPVTNQVTAVIDYTTTITRGPYAFLGGQNVSGPDITFYGAQGGPGYTPAVEVAMQAFGSTGPGLGQRYWMYDVAFNEGASSVSSLAAGDLAGTSTRFLYDTGTTVTLLRNSLAVSLGLAGVPEFYVQVGADTLLGYYLDSITMTGLGGTYTVLGAPVLVTTSALGGSADAIIGSNLFSQTQLRFDGPAGTLGIGEQCAPSIPEPSTLWLVGLGLVGVLRAFRGAR